MQSSYKKANILMLKTIELDKYNVLNLQEERELIRLYQENDDKRALNKLVCHNIKFIIHVVNKKLRNKMRNGGFIKDDLIQECYFALVKAAKNFDLNREGIRYIQYAKFWVTAATQDYFHKNNALVKNSEGDVFFENTTSASNNEKDTLNRLDFLATKNAADQHFQSFSYADDACENLLFRNNQERLNSILDNMKKRLSDKEISILSERLMADDPLTLAEIGAKYNISRERIRQIEFRLIDKLKKEFNEKGITQDWS